MRQAGRQTGKQTDRQAEKQIDRDKGRGRERERERGGRQAGRQAGLMYSSNSGRGVHTQTLRQYPCIMCPDFSQIDTLTLRFLNGLALVYIKTQMACDYL